MLTRIQWTSLLTVKFVDTTIYLLEILVQGLSPQTSCSLKLTYFLGEVCASDLIHLTDNLQAISCPLWLYSY
jgi:hypothetical protein